MMSSNNCVEVLGKSVGWEVRGQLYKHYIINVPNNILRLPGTEALCASGWGMIWHGTPATHMHVRTHTILSLVVFDCACLMLYITDVTKLGEKHFLIFLIISFFLQFVADLSTNETKSKTFTKNTGTSPGLRNLISIFELKALLSNRS